MPFSEGWGKVNLTGDALQSPEMTPQRSPDWFALLAVVLSIVLHIILDAEKPFLPFIVGCCVFWVGFILWRGWQNPRIFREWGFRTDHLREASTWPFLFLVLMTIAMAIGGHFQNTLRFPSHLPLLLLLYPLWGIIQQFLALGIVVQSLEQIPRLRENRLLIALLTSGLFALVHVNAWQVALATFGLEIVFVILYFRDRNLIPLAIVHGFLGAFFYLWILDVDLWVETFGER